MKKFIISLCLSLFYVILAQAQQDSRVLMTVNGMPVTVEEFKYIYEKSNGKDADYSRKSLEDYLELYKNFKLKVALAREVKLDTSPALLSELNGYRKKLANAYLIDKEVADKLAREAYDRMHYDVRLSHIFFSTKNLRSPADTALVLKRAHAVLDRLKRGESFEEIAKILSEDKNSAKKGGDIGYFTAIFPPGFYRLEQAAYTTPVGQIAGPVRSVSGYHIIKVTDKRPARGEMEIAQIFFAKDPAKPDSLVRQRAEEALFSIRKAKMPFEEAAKQFSDDKTTGAKGGYVGFIGINRFEKDFEDAVFALKKDGEISGIVESSVGFHIIKRLRKKELGPYKKEKRAILAKLRKDPRYQLAVDAFIEKTKKEANFMSNAAALQKWIRSLPDSTFLTHKWELPKTKDQTVLFTIGGQKRTIRDMDEYAHRATRKRLRFGRNTKVADAARQLYNDFVKEQVMAYAESKLEEKYPEFKALMREYEEGILLFEISRREVWDKAAQDSVGLAKFYETIKNSDPQFQWEERAKLVTYTIPKSQEVILKKLRRYAKRKAPAKVLKKFNKGKRIVSMERKTVEKSKAPDAVRKLWRKRAITPTVYDLQRKPPIASFTVIEDLLPAGPKKLDEARGYAIAKYQDYLEEHWVKTLQSRYKVEINKEVFESLVKKQ